jgi:hypothetical protein
VAAKGRVLNKTDGGKATPLLNTVSERTGVQPSQHERSRLVL